MAITHVNVHTRAHARTHTNTRAHAHKNTPAHREILESHWSMTELRRAVEKKKPIVIVKDDTFPNNLPGKFPKDAKPVEKIIRREWER